MLVIAPVPTGIKNKGVTDERMRKMMRSPLFIPTLPAQSLGLLLNSPACFGRRCDLETVPSIIPGSWRVESCSVTERSQNPTHPNNPFNPLFLMPMKARGATNGQER